MKKVAVLFHEGFEEVEALSVVDVMRRANVECTMVGMDNMEVVSSHQVTIKMDCVYNEDIKAYDAVVIPGGIPGARNLRDDKRVIELIKGFNEANKIVAAICAGPIVLEEAKVITDKTVTCFPGFDEELVSANYQEALVQRDGNVITGKGPAASFMFAYTILDALGGNSQPVKDSMQYTYLENNK